MASTISRGHLMEMHNDLQAAKKYAPGLIYLLRSRMDDFYMGSGSKKGNAEAINQTIKRQSKLQQEYFQFTDDEEPQIKMTPAVPAVPAKMEKNPEGEYVEVEAAKPAIEEQPVMQEGKTYEEFNEKWKALMKEMVNVY